MTLFRPVGLRELELIAALNWRAFPPRLEIQPIFYPVLNFEYAAQIAREWNTRDVVSGFAGWVTRFEVEDEYAQKFEPQTVGAAMHRELWVPSEELDEFNAHIVGPIQIEAVFTGEKFEGEIDEESKLPRDVVNKQLQTYNGKPVVECQIVFLPESEGGRRYPFPNDALSGCTYRPHLVVGDPMQRTPIVRQNNVLQEDYLGVAFLSGPENVAVGQPLRVRLVLMYFPNVKYSDLQVSASFTIREGGGIVGYGEVLARTD